MESYLANEPCGDGALLSTVSSGQGESIPCISHAVAIEVVE